MATRVVASKCPNCNASLSIVETAAIATCTYCGESCRVQQRTKFLQRPVAPHVTPNQYANEVRVNALRVAQTTPRYTWLYVIISLLMTVGMGGASYFMTRRASTNIASTAKTAFAGMPSPAQVGTTTRQWNGGSVLFGDVNGDGNLDLVGQVKSSFGVVAVAGYSLNNGSQLWESVSLGNDSELETWGLFVAAGYAVQPLRSGELIGVMLGGSGVAWRLTLGDKFDKACATDDPALVLVETTDKKRRLVDVRTGTASAAPSSKGKRPACQPLYVRNAVPGALPAEGLWSGIRQLRKSAMDVKVRVVLPDGDMIILGIRSPGTAVPTVARVAVKRKKYELLWKVETPSTNLLNAEFEESVAVVDELVITPIIDKQGREVSLVALAISDGARQWSVNLSLNWFRAMSVHGSTLFVSCLTGVAAVDIHNGNLLWTTH